MGRSLAQVCKTKKMTKQNHKDFFIYEALNYDKKRIIILRCVLALMRRSVKKIIYNFSFRDHIFNTIKY